MGIISVDFISFFFFYFFLYFDCLDISSASVRLDLENFRGEFLNFFDDSISADIYPQWSDIPRKSFRRTDYFGSHFTVVESFSIQLILKKYFPVMEENLTGF